MMKWKEEDMDLILVPSGLLIMFGYHLYLLYRCLRLPKTTVIGYENHCKKAWVEKMLQIEVKDRSQCLGVISSTISTSTFLASISLALSSLIGAWAANSSGTNIFSLGLIYGDSSSYTISTKYISILSCFLVAFGAFLQCARYFVHTNFLMSMPCSDVPVEYVQDSLIRGSAFWSLGLRAIYFATNLMLWIFGPIPFFLSSVILVGVLHSLDRRVPMNFHDFSAKRHGVLKKIGEDVSAVARAVKHHHHHEQRI